MMQPCPRRGRRYLPARLALLAGLLAAGPAAVAQTLDIDEPTPQWRRGPVRYLLTRAEARLFKGLETEAERAAFIEAFWRRRDPTPETPQNEFRDRFIERVERSESLRRYVESTKPMWLTDMGKIYILLGAPVAETRDQVATSERDTITWTYDQVPGVSQRNFSVAFVADESGEMRLSEQPSLDRNTFLGLDPPASLNLFTPGGPTGAAASTAAGALRATTSGSTALFVAGWSAAGGALPFDPVFQGIGEASGPSELGRATTLGRIQRTDLSPGQAQIEVASSFDPIPLALHTDFYQAADGTTYSAFTFGPEEPVESAGPLLPFGAIISLDRPEVTYSLQRGDQFAAAGPEAPGVYQTGLGLDPGRYRVVFGLADPASGRVGMHETDVSVVDLDRRGLNLSTLTLARSLRPLEPGEAAGGEFKLPFVLGTLRVVPRPVHRIANGEDFHVYFQIYGAQPTPDGTPLLDITYGFEGHDGEGWVPLGKPIPQEGMRRSALAWSFPLNGWPAGRFRLTVRVVDRLTGATTSDRLVFQVLDPAG